MLPVATLVFMTLFITPLDTVISNQAYLVITPGLFWPWTLLASVILTVLGATVIALFPEKVRWVLTGLVCGLSLALFVQLLFFNSGLGVLDGSEPDWSGMKGKIILNSAVWVVLVLLPVILSFVLKEGRRTLITAICLAILCAQSVSLFSVWTTSDKTSKYSEEYVLNGKDQFTVSSGNNMLVFSLDYFSKDLFDEILEKYPDVKEEYRDFVYYDNTCGNYDFTFPSLCCLFTGMEYTGDIKSMDYFEAAWNSEKAEDFYALLHNNGYEVSIYTDINYSSGYGYNLLGKVDNLVGAEAKLTAGEMLRLLHVCAYRLAPMGLKRYLILSTDDINEKMEYTCRDGIEYEPAVTEGTFFQKLKSGGLSVTDEHNVYAWTHLLGAHVPHTTDETGEPSEDADEISQCRGYLHMISEYMQQMKKLGVYDDAVIVITADHGESPSYFVPLLIKDRNESGDSISFNHAPASQMDILPTLAYMAGGQAETFGTPVTALREDQERERVFRKFEILEEYEPAGWAGSIGQLNMQKDWGSHYNVLLEYRFTGDQDNLKLKVRSAEHNILMLKDSFY